MAEQHGIIGDDNFGTELPVTQPDEAGILEERHMAKFSKTKEYGKLKEHLDQRIEFYQAFLPNGEDLRNADVTKLGQQWAVANAIIAEFKAVLLTYENARDAVEGSDAQ